ncbi:MAG: preprotein translocase subunit SecE [Phycisphaerae bacterium]|nr:preprotein translocase subunit SecE [Phycisphaerae bacterium]
METALTKPSDRPTDQDRQDLKEAGRLGFGIYKYGQGYWVRVMTAVFAGMIVLAGAMWAWNRLAAVSIPVAEYILPVARPSGTASLGQEVTLRRGTDAIGVAKIASINSDGSILHLKELNLNKGKSLLDTDRVETAAGFAGAAGRPEPVYLFQRVYLQAGVAILIIIVGGIVIYRYVALKRTSADFLIATDGEMKKVNWSTRKTIIDSTSVVISATFLIAAFIFLFDTLLSRFFMLIDVIKT